MNILRIEEGASVFIPVYSTAVPAGFPSPATDYMEERIDLNKELIKHPLATFIVSCEGDSMINAFIPPKCKLIVDRSIIPQNGSIVVAVVNTEFTVKYLKKNAQGCWLIPANKKYDAIAVFPEAEMSIWGVVTQILINPKDVQCML